MKKLVVNDKYNGKKLSDKRVSKDCIIYSGDEICIYLPDYLLNNNLILDIVYEDDNILIINKPQI